MASAEELFECLVCLEQMVNKNPRLLSCHHGFCSPCLTQLSNNGNIICPICRIPTHVPRNDISKLPMNFHLLKMWELLEHGRKPKETQAVQCQVCKREDATTRCEKCNKIFCEACEAKHSEVKIYSDHVVYDLCLVHTESVTHLCKRCKKPACTTCMLIEHRDHSEECVEYAVGIEKIKEDLKSLKLNVEAAQKRIEIKGQLYQKQEKNLNQIILSIKQRTDFHNQKAKFGEELLAKLGRNPILSTKTQLVNYIKERATCIKTLYFIDKGLIMKGNKILSHFEEANAKARVATTSLQESFIPAGIEFMSEVNDLCHIPPWILKPVEYQMVNGKELEGLKLVKSLQLRDAKGIAASNVTSVFVAEPKRVLVIDVTGIQMLEFTPKNNIEDIVDVTSFNNTLYILQPSTITAVNMSTMEQKEYTTSLSSMSKLHVADGNKFVILSEQTGSAYTFEPQLNKLTTRLQFDSSFINRICSVLNHTGSIHGFALCTCGQIMYSSGQNRLYMFDEEWKLKVETAPYGSGDGELKGPQALITTPSGQLLVADSNNNRISLFSGKGEFIRQVLTSKDGINHPVGLVYQQPYLWVLEYSVLKIYKEQ